MRLKKRTSLIRKIFEPLSRASASGKPDYTLLACVALLLAFGLLMLSSASSIASFEQTKDTTQDSYLIFKQQFTHGVIPGLLVFFILLRISYEKYRRYALTILLAIYGLLLIVFIPNLGVEINGIKAWITVGSITIQTSEIAKLCFVLWLAMWLSTREKFITSWRQTIVPFVVFVGSIIFLLMLQPDMGTMLIFAIVAFTMVYAAGASWRHLTIIAGVGLLVSFLLILAAPYRLERLTTYWRPSSDTQGAGYQLNQSLIAIGSGGWWGSGIGQSRQKFYYLPEVDSDSIFAVIGEEWGFFFSTILIVLFAALFYRGLRIARAAPDMYGNLLALGISSLVTAQAAINISGMLGLLPLTGLPLPFISKGGTNIVMLLAAMAILVNISKSPNLNHG